MGRQPMLGIEERPSLFERIATMGNAPGDTEELRLHKRFLIYMAVLMSGGGILWGTICSVFGLYVPAIIPFGYTVLSIINLSSFAIWKRFRPVRFFQVLISLLLPFLFQWSLGGFVVTGAVMLWALLALIASISFQNVTLAARWFVAYIILTVISGVVDPWLPFRMPSTETTVVMFFVTNVVVISSIVGVLVLYFVHAKEVANAKLLRLKESLESMVATRTHELSDALAHLRAIVDNIADGLVVTDNDGLITHANPALESMFAVDREGVIGRSAKELSSTIWELVHRSCTTRTMSNAEVPLVGRRVAKAVTNTIIKDVDENDSATLECLGSVTVIRDITREKEIDAMKTDFISNVSHELRTPLTSVLGFAKMIGKKFDDTLLPMLDVDDRRVQRAIDQVRGNLNIIVSEGERLTSLINDVLDISKMEAGKIEWKFQPHRLDEVIDRAVAATSGLFAANPRVVLRTEIEENTPVLNMDRDRIIQVLVNLISNANKFTAEGSVTVRTRLSGSEMVVSVVDTGAGIPAEHRTLVFEKFKQVGDTLTDKPMGTGLGLPICKQIVEHHGGRIWVESGAEGGSTFAFSLPLDAASSDDASVRMTDLETLIKSLKRKATEGHVDTDAAAEKRVFIVDDDESIRTLLRQELEDDGYVVDEAVNGTEALEYLRTNRPALMILDVMMPGMNGFDVAAIVRSNPDTMDIPIIIHSIIEDRERGYRLGVDRYLTKPINTQHLLQEIGAVVEQGSKSRKKVLVLDENESTVKSLIDVLSARGYHAIGAYSGTEGLERARNEKPDMVIVDSILSERYSIIQTLRFERETENLVFVVLGEENRNEGDQPKARD